MTMRRSGKMLSEEDRIVWGKVADTVTPLRPRARPAREKASPAAETPAPDKDEQAARRPSTLPPYVPPISAPGAGRFSQRLDRTTRARIAKGRSPLEARLDLHGLTQSEAHALLLRFLRSAQAQGMRHVLVITGKGSARNSEGVLRRLVPGWLATLPFNGIVSSHAEAERRHGGAGALYLRLRRTGRPSEP